MNYKFAIVVFCFLIAACGGGGGGDNDAEIRPVHTVDGYGVDAAICNGTVTAYSWKNGSKEAQLGQGETDEYGYYALSVQTPDQPILLEIQGGYYIEDVSQRKVSLEDGQGLYAVINYSGKDQAVMITPLTTLAAGLAEYYVNNESLAAKDAVTAANSAIVDLYGIDIIKTLPLDITDQANLSGNLTDGHLYGFYLAAFSSWTAQISDENGLNAHTVYNSIGLAQKIYADIRYDGMLNGSGFLPNGKTGTLSLGNYFLTAANYRQMIGHHTIQAAGADYNETGLATEDLIEAAYSYSQKTGDLFDNISALPLDAKGPVIEVTEPAEGQAADGTLTYIFRIIDSIGVKSATATIDGKSVPLAAPKGTDSTVTLEINAFDYDDSSHALIITAEDELGNKTTIELTFTLANTATVQGYGVDAAICDAAVTAYSWQSGSKGDVLGQGETDEFGYYAIDIKAPAQP
ncbi:MAG: hypothetical protein GY874_23465, partial [Desulfobacteraceae bacterium]|nr:hypothetical protein [Desulfobacteraceae bacterium]